MESHMSTLLCPLLSFSFLRFACVVVTPASLLHSLLLGGHTQYVSPSLVAGHLGSSQLETSMISAASNTCSVGDQINALLFGDHL